MASASLSVAPVGDGELDGDGAGGIPGTVTRAPQARHVTRLPAAESGAWRMRWHASLGHRKAINAGPSAPQVLSAPPFCRRIVGCVKRKARTEYHPRSWGSAYAAMARTWFQSLSVPQKLSQSLARSNEDRGQGRAG